MNESRASLADLFECIPTDLAAYFNQIADDVLSGHNELELNLLPVAEAVQWTKDFREFHPVVSVLHGVILDDPNTSNHHVYLSLDSCAGTVFYLSHDAESRIVFPSLAAFLDAARKAWETDESLTTFHPDVGVELSDQRGLSRLIAALLDGQIECDPTDLVVVLIPSMDLNDLPLLDRLAHSEDFYIAEAVGDAIAKRPKPELEGIAELCRQHSHVQAANAGKRAVAAIAALQ